MYVFQIAVSPAILQDMFILSGYVANIAKKGYNLNLYQILFKSAHLFNVT